MTSMFENCSNFNRDLNDWNVLNILNMDLMFKGCLKFNHLLYNWDFLHFNKLNIFDSNNINIYNKISIMKYKDLTKNQKENKHCPITYDNFINDTLIIKTKCNHIFSKNGLELWLKTKRNCPMCMASI